MEDNYRENLEERVRECSTVINGLKNNPGWDILIRDLSHQREIVDNNWHLIFDEKKLTEFRITKMAVMHVADILSKYEADLEAAQSELQKMNNPKEEVLRDYDTETKIED